MLQILKSVMGYVYLDGHLVEVLPVSFIEMFTVPYLIMIVQIISYLRKIMVTTVTTCQYTVQIIVTNRKLQ